jgi:hypothetical protein
LANGNAAYKRNTFSNILYLYKLSKNTHYGIWMDNDPISSCSSDTLYFLPDYTAKSIDCHCPRKQDDGSGTGLAITYSII